MDFHLSPSRFIIMMRYTLFLLGLLAGAPQAAEPRPAGRNCNLTAPPAAAGEETQHGKTLRVFPRNKDINASYTGCQVLFMPWRAKWEVIALTEIVNGDPVRVWSDNAGGTGRLACRYRSGKVVKGTPQTCPATEELLTKSMAPGCLDLIRASVAKGGPGAPRPAQCAYD